MTVSTTTRKTEDLTVGRYTSEGWDGKPLTSRVDIDMRLTTYSEGPYTTVDHEEVDSYVEFAASGAVVERGMMSRGGQMLDELLKVQRVSSPWKQHDLLSLFHVWEKFHLNGMTAACSHMTRDTLVYEDNGFGGRRISCSGNVCPETGYTYGKAWLVKPIPDVYMREIERLFAIAEKAAR